MDISKLLTFSAKEGASDCHISAGEPPMIRVNGDLKKLDHPPLTQEETHALVYDMMSKPLEDAEQPACGRAEPSRRQEMSA